MAEIQDFYWAGYLSERLDASNIVLTEANFSEEGSVDRGNFIYAGESAIAEANFAEMREFDGFEMDQKQRINLVIHEQSDNPFTSLYQ